MRKTIHIVHTKQAITKLVNIVILIVNEHLACSRVADATSETLNAQGSCSEKNKSFVGNNKDLRKTTECQLSLFNDDLSVLQTSSFTAR